MSNKPNILFIFTDQHRLSAVGAYGDTPCETPNIDRLAEEGILFENAYTVYPVCSPARGSVMTGLYPHSHGITSNIHEVGASVHELQDRHNLLPRRLQGEGYNTGYTGKWHLGTDKLKSFGQVNSPSLPSSMGFEGQDFQGHGGNGIGFPVYKNWLKQKGYEEYQVKPWREDTDKIREGIRELDLPTEASVPYFLVDKTIELIEDFDGQDKPYFMSLNFWGPHSPYEATSEFVDMYRDKEIPPWPNYEWPATSINGPHHMKVYWDQEDTDWEEWETAVRYYYARTTMIDSQIGRLLDYLEKSNKLEDTVIIFTADHGETLGSHGGLLDKGWHHFEETHRIPMIIRLPESEKKGITREKFASLADIYPTILDLAGCYYDEDEVHGRSLLPLIEDENIDWRDIIVTEFLGLGNIPTCMKTIRKDNIKYGANLSGAKDELYDLEQDPHEMKNLIDNPEYESVLKEMRQKLVEWMEETDDPGLRMYKWYLSIKEQANKTN